MVEPGISTFAVLRIVAPKRILSEEAPELGRLIHQMHGGARPDQIPVFGESHPWGGHGNDAITAPSGIHPDGKAPLVNLFTIFLDYFRQNPKFAK